MEIAGACVVLSCWVGFGPSFFLKNWNGTSIEGLLVNYLLRHIKYFIMNLIKHNPFRTNDFDRFFHDFLSAPVFNYRPSAETNTTPAVNVVEYDSGFELSVAAPGYNKDDFEISVEKDLLTISATIEDTKEEKDNSRVTRKEFSFRSFTRQFHLSKDISKDDVTAKYENGVLSIHLKKLTPSSEEKKTIEIG